MKTKTKKVYRLGLYTVREHDDGAVIIKNNDHKITFFIPIKFYPANNMFFGAKLKYRLTCKKANGNIVLIALTKRKAISIAKLPINELDFLVEKIQKIIFQLKLEEKISFRIIFNDEKINFYCSAKNNNGQNFLTKFSLEISNLKNNSFFLLGLEMEANIKKIAEYCFPVEIEKEKKEVKIEMKKIGRPLKQKPIIA